MSNLFFDLDKLKNVQNVVIDFTNLNWSTPTGMLVAGSKLREWVSSRSNRGLHSYPIGISKIKTGHTYLMHFGFFKYIFMDEGSEVGQASGGNRYLPITRVIKPVFSPFEQTLQDWYEAIQSESKRLANVICGDSRNSEVHSAYIYSIREILRTVFEHSNAKECFICGQRWANGKAEIAIIDEGVGISKTLQESYSETVNDIDALSLAIQPGVSRTSAFPESRNYFDNSGFGLYILSELGSQYGWFTLGSGNARINCQNGIIQSLPISFKGTFVALNIHKPVVMFSKKLLEIIAEGEKISGKNGINARASGASKLLNL